MGMTIGELAALCERAGLRHHLDPEELVIRVVLVTPRYVNARGEPLAILQIEAPDSGNRCRVVLERVCPVGRTPADTWLAAMRCLGDLPFVRLEDDSASRSLRLVADIPVEDGAVTIRQLCVLCDGVVAAAEAVQAAVGRHRGRIARSKREAA